jgi:predicted DNA-binding protein
MQYTKDLAKARQELKIEHWVVLTIKIVKSGSNIELYHYDLPGEVYERRWWVVRWRQSRYQCLYPRENISLYHSFYDKRSGLDMGFDSILSKLASAKAWVTRIERAIEKHIEYNKANNLFFCIETDEQLKKPTKNLHGKKIMWKKSCYW